MCKSSYAVYPLPPRPPNHKYSNTCNALMYVHIYIIQCTGISSRSRILLPGTVKGGGGWLCDGIPTGSGHAIHQYISHDRPAFSISGSNS